MPTLASITKLCPSKYKGLFQGHEQLVRDPRGTYGGGRREEQAKLIPAEPRDRVRFAQDALEARGQLLQQRITAGVAKGSVDLLEAVKIHEQERQGTAITAGSENGLPQTVVEQGAVGPSGQGVMQGLAAQGLPRLSPLAWLADGARLTYQQAQRPGSRWTAILY